MRKKEEEGERAKGRASDLAYLIYPHSPIARWTDGRTGGRADGRASVVPRSLSSPLRSAVALGHAIRVESVSDCHDGRWVARSESPRGGLGNARDGTWKYSVGRQLEWGILWDVF